jgi:hypothetical protein
MLDQTTHGDDVVITIPQGMVAQWFAEGDLAGDPPGGLYDTYAYTIGRKPGDWVKPGCRVYVVFYGAVRGWAPLTGLEPWDQTRWALLRQRGAVACTIPERVPGFRGIRRRWWDRDSEIDFPDWKTDGIPDSIARWSA